jgi:hypothetical protein
MVKEELENNGTFSAKEEMNQRVRRRLGMVVHVCNSSTWETEAGRS